MSEACVFHHFQNNKWVLSLWSSPQRCRDSNNQSLLSAPQFGTNSGMNIRSPAIFNIIRWVDQASDVPSIIFVYMFPSFWLLQVESHDFFKLRKKELHAKLSKFTKWQPFSLELMTIPISIYHSVSPSALHPKSGGNSISLFFLRIYSQVKIKLWGTI